jgi:predicted extracellular nuclease
MRLRRALATVAVAVTAMSVVGPAGGAAAATPADLFISEYVEGAGNNKALELFNGTGAPIDLAAGEYVLQMYFNGATTATTVPLTGKVAAGDVYVFAASGASAPILAQADQTYSGALFNGDDAIVLRRGGAAGTVLDSIGQVGVDPGTEWGTGLASTADNTLRRAANVTSGDTTIDDPFDPAGQWVGFAQDSVDGLGSHSVSGGNQPAVLTVGEVEGPTLDSEAGRTDRSPLAPAAGNSTSSAFYDVQGVITQKALSRTSAGASQHGFFLQSRLGAADGDPNSSDGVFVFMGSFTTLVGGYEPKVGDEVILHAKVAEFFNQTQLTSASLVRVVETGLDVDTAVAVTDTTPPADSAAADRYWERHEGERMRVRAGSVVTGARDVFASTADSEVWVLDREDPLAKRADPYARRSFRDPHPLDDLPATGFDNGNGQRILLGSQGVKAASGDNTTLLPPARGFDTVTSDAFGAVTYGFNKYSVQPAQVAFTAGTDPAANHPVQPADRGEQVAVATFNMENLYDYRDDPFDGCDFTGNTGCTGVSPPFDYVPASEEAYRTRLNGIASQVINDLKAPDLILTQEAEDQDICTVTSGALTCGTTDAGPKDNADGKPDALQELAIAIAAQGGPAYDTAYDRNGADARGITSAFLFRTDRLSLPAPAANDPILGSAPTVRYRSAGLPYNADVQNPKSLNAVLPADVDRRTGVDGSNVYTRAPQVAHFFVKAAAGDWSSSEGYDLWAVSNHYSSTPDARVGQRTEQAAYGAAIAQAVKAAAPNARFVYGGDLNVFPRPDDPIARTDTDTPSDQLGPLYRAGLHNLWDDLVAADPAAAYSYSFQGQAQTLDHLFVDDNLHRDLVEMRAAHVNADYAADYDGDGARGVSDHDPQVARFRSRAYLSVADASVAEGDSGTRKLVFPVTLSRPMSQDSLLCGATLDQSATSFADYDPLFGCTVVKAGATSAEFAVTVKGDRRPEPDEKFLVIVGADPRLRYTKAIATGTIVNDD